MRTTSVWVCAVALLAIAGGRSAGAQAPAGGQAPPARTLVTTTKVKPDMAAAWRAVQQNEVVPALKKAGVTWRWVFTSGPLGGDGFTYLTAQPITNFAQFDNPNPVQRALGQDGAAKLGAKTAPMIVSTHNVLQALVTNASMQSFPSAAPPLIRVSTILLVPGKGGDFATMTREDSLPALKKAGVTDYLVFAANYGAPGHQRTVVEYLTKYGDLDQPNPMVRALGQEAAQKVQLKRQAITLHNEAAVYRLVPELSFGAPARPK